jgi:hypothetical protein
VPDCAAASHTYALLDARIYGFALHEASLPFEGPDGVQAVAEPIVPLVATGASPHLVEMATSYYAQPRYDLGNEFDFGLSLSFDALDRSATGDGTNGARGGIDPPARMRRGLAGTNKP